MAQSFPQSLLRLRVTNRSGAMAEKSPVIGTSQATRHSTWETVESSIRPECSMRRHDNPPAMNRETPIKARCLISLASPANLGAQEE